MDMLTILGGACLMVLVYADFRNADKNHEERITKIEQREVQQEILAREERNRIDSRLQNIEALLYKLLGKQEMVENRR